MFYSAYTQSLSKYLWSEWKVHDRILVETKIFVVNIQTVLK